MKYSISFDFDDTLSELKIQYLAYSLIQNGYKVCICTARHDDDDKLLNDDLFEVVHRLGLTEKDVIFCGGSPKHLKLAKIPDLLFHLDDNFHETRAITESNHQMIGLYILKDDWASYSFKTETKEQKKVRNIIGTLAKNYESNLEGCSW